MSRALGLLPLAFPLLLGACSLPLAGGNDKIENSCEDHSACGPDGACVDGICVSTRADLARLLIQVEVPADARYAANTSSVIDYEVDIGPALQGHSAAGFARIVDLLTEDAATVEASLHIEEAAWTPFESACAGLRDSDGFIPIHAELRQRLEAVGIPLNSFSKSSTENPESNHVTLTVQTGTYDLSIRPAISDQDPNLEGCKLPPLLFPSQQIKPSFDANYTATAAPTELTGDFFGDYPDIASWTVDIVDNVRGRVISTVSSITVDPENPDFRVSMWPETLQNPEIVPVVRITPPPVEPGVQNTLPVILWHLQSVDLDANLHLELDVTPLASATTIEVGGHVVDASLDAVPATLVIQSKALFDGGFGDNASLRTTVSTDKSGTWSASLLPGKYSVIALPASDPSLAVTANVLQVASDDFGQGKTIQVFPKARMSGRAITPGGAPAASVPVFVQPSFGPATSFLKSVLDQAEIMPGTSNAATVADGSFVLSVDPGELDLSLKPPSGSGLPWLVRSRIGITAAADPMSADLGELRISYPVVLAGQVRSPYSFVAGAQIRAFVTVDNPNDDGSLGRPTAIQIAETTADASGMYRLLLPASISQ